jgi:thymidylate synthase ThyX
MPRVELPDPYKVSIVLDSINPVGDRLTTFALTYPRFVHAELMTHRIFSRNSASSRAIPSEKMRDLVKNHPALPVWWGKNQSGMQAREQLDDASRAEAKRLWLEARDVMLSYSDKLAQLGLHKQLANRLTEPWMPITVLVSATSFANWFHLRDHKDAQPELQIVATEMHHQYLESQPQSLRAGEWHMPYIRHDDHAAASDYTKRINFGGGGGRAEREDDYRSYLRRVSVGRCARVSYLTHEGRRDLEKDIELHDKLAATASSEDPGHFSPFEHVAEALDKHEPSGNFRGWRQYRKLFPTEAGPKGALDG